MRLDRRVAAVWGFGAAFVALWVLLHLPSDDLAGAVYRADLFSADGYLLWDNGWYAGHHMLAYSVLYPPLGALLGPRLLGSLVTVAAVIAFQQLVTPRLRRARVDRRGLVRDLRGRQPVRGSRALRARHGPRPLDTGRVAGQAHPLTLLLALLTGLASPVAGAFLGLAGLAKALAGVRPAAQA
jgi:hypothetical protein